MRWRIEAEHELVRFLAAPVGEPSTIFDLAKDKLFGPLTHGLTLDAARIGESHGTTLRITQFLLPFGRM